MTHLPGTSRSRILRWILLYAALILAAGIGLRDPSPPDEPRFVLAAQHMVESGDWLFPHRGSELYSHKPPPFMWMQAAAYSVVGNWRVAFLLPSLLAALGTLWLVHDLAGRVWGRRFAAYASLSLLVTLQFGLQAKRGQIDMLLVFLTTLSLYALARHLLLSREARWSWLGWFAAGAGTITKGVGFLPLLMYLPALAARRLGWRHLAPPAQGKALLMQFAPLAFLLAAGLWLVPMLLAVAASDDPALHSYAREILLKQTGERYAKAWHHIQPPWYFLQVIATLWLPLALALPGLLPAWWRRLRRRDARYLVLLGWSLLVLLFFSASPGKREVYILPALPALCIAAAPLLPGLLRRVWLQRVLLGYVIVLSACALALGSGLFGEAEWERRLLAARGLESTPSAFFAWLLAIGAGGLLLAATLRGRRVGLAVLGFSGLLWVGYGAGLMPLLNDSSSSRAVMLRAGEIIGPEAELALLGWREQQLLQADRPATDFGFEREWGEQWPDAAAWLRERPERRWLFLIRQGLSRCIDPQGVVDVGIANRREWVLIPAAALRPDCQPGTDETFEQREVRD